LAYNGPIGNKEQMMNGKIKFHKATGPAFNVGEVWVANGVRVEIVSVEKYPGATDDHTSSYNVIYRETLDGILCEKDAWNFQVRYTHQADLFV
jgi:hypothetical protein